MALTPELVDVIQLSKALEQEATKLDAMKAEKVTHQNAISGLNDQIIAQTTVVNNARTALKTAANLI